MPARMLQDFMMLYVLYTKSINELKVAKEVLPTREGKPSPLMMRTCYLCDAK